MPAPLLMYPTQHKITSEQGWSMKKEQALCIRDRAFDTLLGQQFNTSVGDWFFVGDNGTFDGMPEPTFWDYYEHTGDPVEPKPAFLGALTEETRDFDTAFQPSATRPSRCTYSFRMTHPHTVLNNGARVRIRVLIGETSSPTIEAGVWEAGVVGTAALSTDATHTHGGQLFVEVPAGWYVLLEKTDVDAGGTTTIQNATERLY